VAAASVAAALRSDPAIAYPARANDPPESTVPRRLLLLSLVAPLLLPAAALAQGGEEELARFRSWAAPTSAPADEPFGVHYEFENRSEDPWSADFGHRLVPVPPTDGAAWSVEEVLLLPGEEVAPGDRKVFSFTVRAPTQAGTYPFRWQLVQDEEPIGELPPEHEIEVVARDPEVDYEPLFYRRHTGSVEHNRQRDLSLFTDDGQPLFLVGKSAFGLLARRGPSSYLEEAAAEGFNMVRVFLLASDIVADERFSGDFEQYETGWPWEWKPGPEDWTVDEPRNRYWNRLDTLMDKAREEGMVVELVLFTPAGLTWFDNPTEFDETKQEYVRQVVERLGDRTTETGNLYRSRAGHAYLEVAHEYDRGADGPGPNTHEGLSADFVRQVAEFILAEEARVHGIPQDEVRRLVTVSGTPSDEPVFADEPWNAILDLHLPKVDRWESRIRDVMLGLRERGKPMVDDLSVGTGDQLPDELRDDDADKHRLRMWAAAMAGGFSTFHSARAIPAVPGAMLGAEAAGPLRRFFERLDHWEMEPDEEHVLASDAKTTWALASRSQLAVYLQTSDDGSGTLQVELHQRGARPLRYEVRWFDPVEGTFLNRLWLPAGVHDLPLPGLVPDVALVATSLTANRTPALTLLQPDCLPLNYEGSLTLRGQDFQPGIHLLVEGWAPDGEPLEPESPVPLSYVDDREAVLSLHRYLGEELERDEYELYPATFVLGVRNYPGLTSGPLTLRVVPEASHCEEDYVPDTGNPAPDVDAGSAEGEGEDPDAGEPGDAAAPADASAAPPAGDGPACDCSVAAGASPAGVLPWLLGLLVPVLRPRRRR